MIAANDKKILDAGAIPAGRVVVNPAVARVKAIEDSQTNRRATLSDPAPRDDNVGLALGQIHGEPFQIR